jgi:glutathione S-transferase
VHPRLVEWRERMGDRPAVRRVVGAMANYLRSQGRKLPDFLARLSA